MVEGGLKLHGLSKGEHVFLIVGPADYHLIDALASNLPTLLVHHGLPFLGKPKG
jgi:hypothetical protein